MNISGFFLPFDVVFHFLQACEGKTLIMLEQVNKEWNSLLCIDRDQVESSSNTDEEKKLQIQRLNTIDQIWKEKVCRDHPALRLLECWRIENTDDINTKIEVRSAPTEKFFALPQGRPSLREDNYYPFSSRITRSNTLDMLWKAYWIHFYLQDFTKRIRAISRVVDSFTRDADARMKDMMNAMNSMKRENHMRDQLEKWFRGENQGRRHWGDLCSPLAKRKLEGVADEDDNEDDEEEKQEEKEKPADKMDLDENLSRNKQMEMRYLVDSVHYEVITIASQIDYNTENYKWDLVYAAHVRCQIIGRTGYSLFFEFIGESTHCYEDADDRHWIEVTCEDTASDSTILFNERIGNFEDPSPKALLRKASGTTHLIKDRAFIRECMRVLKIEYLDEDTVWSFLSHAIVPRGRYASHTHGFFQNGPNMYTDSIYGPNVVW